MQSMRSCLSVGVFFLPPRSTLGAGLHAVCRGIVLCSCLPWWSCNGPRGNGCFFFLSLFIPSLFFPLSSLFSFSFHHLCPDMLSLFFLFHPVGGCIATPYFVKPFIPPPSPKKFVFRYPKENQNTPHFFFP